MTTVVNVVMDENVVEKIISIHMVQMITDKKPTYIVRNVEILDMFGQIVLTNVTNVFPDDITITSKKADSHQIQLNNVFDIGRKEFKLLEG